MQLLEQDKRDLFNKLLGYISGSNDASKYVRCNYKSDITQTY